MLHTQNPISKIKNYRLLIIISLASAFLMPIAMGPNVVQAQSDADPVKVYCLSKVPKARASCDYATERSRNAASYACKKISIEDKKAACIASKAKDYIKDASGGSPNDQKFKSQLNEVLDKVCKGIANCPEEAEASSKQSLKPDVNDGQSPGFGGGKNIGKYYCGTDSDSDNNVETKFNFGCIGPKADYSGPILSPIEDAVYAIIRFLSAGIGVAVVISIIIAGIKYSSSEGNAEATQAAKNRIRNTLIGLLVYIFAFSIMQYLVPGGVFN